MPLTAEEAINLISGGVEISFFNAPLRKYRISIRGAREADKSFIKNLEKGTGRIILKGQLSPYCLP
jgi:hypothetical protein